MKNQDIRYFITQLSLKEFRWKWQASKSKARIEFVDVMHIDFAYAVQQQNL